MNSRKWQIVGLVLGIGSMGLDVSARYHDRAVGDRMARGFFGGATTGALIGGLAGGGRGAGIGFGIGAATGLMAGAAASERDRYYDDYYDDYQESPNEAGYDQSDYDQDNTEYYNDDTNELSLNISDLKTKTLQTAMDDSSVEVQPIFSLENLPYAQKHQTELDQTATEQQTPQQIY